MLVVAALLAALLTAGVSGVPVSVGKSQTTAPGRALQPKISYSRKTVSKPGEDVTIDCGVEGIDLSGVSEFNVAWSKIDLKKPTNSYPISSGETITLFSAKYEVLHPKDTYQYSLKIKNIDEDDTGTYRCTVNFGDNQKINAEVPVLIEKPPYFVDPSTKTLTVTEGDAISIDCQPGGSPEPTVFWERVNKELPFYGGNFFKDHQLEIPFVESSHSGRYVCHADNGLGEPAKSEVILSVQYPPKLQLNLKEVAASVDEEVLVECRVDAFPASQATWYRGKDPILGSVNIRVTQRFEEKDARKRSGLDELDPASKSRVLVSTLSITSVTVDDIGNYTCQATNAVGSANDTVALALKTPPRIERQSSGRVFYNDEKAMGRTALPVAIECQASGAPDPEYKWLKNNKEVYWPAHPRLSLQPGTGTLLIEDPVIEDNGWYQCIAYNELGVAKSDPIYLLNATRVTFDINAKPFLELTAEEGRPFRMPCPNVTGEPTPTITWTIASTNSDVDGQTRMEFFSSNRTVVGPDGNAYFTHITQKDDSETNNITYLCLGVSEASPQDYSLGTSVKLKVISPKDGIENGQKDYLNIETFLMYGSPNVTLVKGARENRLWCIFGGEPEPVIVWEKLDGTPLVGPDYVLDNYNSTLIIKNTNLSHQGDYRCTGSNRVGPASLHNMTVQVDMPPVFREAMESVTVEEGSVVTFVCDAEGSGVLTYIWNFNGRELGPSVIGSRRSVEGNRLTISSVSVTDIGNYACNATSLSGYAYGQATLNVLKTSSASTASGGSCSEVTSLRGELLDVKKAVDALRLFVQTTGSAQADANIDIVQRIAAKMDLLSKEELELFDAQNHFKRTQEEHKIQADLQQPSNNRDSEPQVIYSETKSSLRNAPVEDSKNKSGEEGGEGGEEGEKGGEEGASPPEDGGGATGEEDGEESGKDGKGGKDGEEGDKGGEQGGKDGDEGGKDGEEGGKGDKNGSVKKEDSDVGKDGEGGEDSIADGEAGEEGTKTGGEDSESGNEEEEAGQDVGDAGAEEVEAGGEGGKKQGGGSEAGVQGDDKGDDGAGAEEGSENKGDGEGGAEGVKGGEEGGAGGDEGGEDGKDGEEGAKKKGEDGKEGEEGANKREDVKEMGEAGNDGEDGAKKEGEDGKEGGEDGKDGEEGAKKGEEDGKEGEEDGKDGEQGVKKEGEDGKEGGDDGKDGEDGAKKGEDGKKGGEAGEDGEEGAKKEVEDVKEGGEDGKVGVEDVINKGEDGKEGEDGKDGEESAKKGEKDGNEGGEDGRDEEKGAKKGEKNGKEGEESGKDGEEDVKKKGEDGKEGEDGKDGEESAKKEEKDGKEGGEDGKEGEGGKDGDEGAKKVEESGKEGEKDGEEGEEGAKKEEDGKEGEDGNDGEEGAASTDKEEEGGEGGKRRAKL